MSLHQEKHTVSDFQSSYGNVFNNKSLLADVVVAGLPWSVFREIQLASSFTDDEMSIYLNISEKSLKRYEQAKNHVFKPIHSERILELSWLSDFGIRALNSPSGFASWLRHPNTTLGKRSPFQLLQSSFGREILFQELSAIAHGNFA